MRSALSGLFVAAMLGCGTDGVPDDDQDPGDGPGSDVEPMPEGMTKLIGRTWSIEPGVPAAYKCVRVTVPEDTYITAIQAQAPIGTHHTVLSLASTNGTQGADGEQDCGVGTIGMFALYASGVGTSPLAFPDGVGIKVAAGQQLHLNIHLANTGDVPLTGETAILVKAQKTPPRMLAEMVFAGTYSIAVPPDGLPHEVVGGCTAADTYSLFAVWPHMHQLATHHKLELVRDGRSIMLHDKPFVFAEQTYFKQDPIAQVQTGDQVKVTCTYVNNTGTSVVWGDGANQEMCFSGLYRFPAGNAGAFACTDNPNQ